jgi:hypothetical protein
VIIGFGESKSDRSNGVFEKKYFVQILRCGFWCAEKQPTVGDFRFKIS